MWCDMVPAGALVWQGAEGVLRQPPSAPMKCAGRGPRPNSPPLSFTILTCCTHPKGWKLAWSSSA